MSELEPKENSVLVALRELQRIERERVQKEQEAEDLRLDGDRRAREETERQARAEAEQRARDEEQRRQQAEEERQRQEREERLRLEEAERRARIEAQATLDRERIRIEAEARAKGHRVPWGPVGAAIGILVIAAGALGYLLIQKEQERKQAAEAARLELEANEARLSTLTTAMTKSQERMHVLEERLARAKTQAEIEAIRQRIEQEHAETQRIQTDIRHEQKKPASGKKPGKKAGLNCNPDDPLCGIEK